MNSVAQVLQTALETERKGRAFYLDAKQRVTDPVVKTVLLALANDEEEHERVITSFYEALERRQGWPVPKDGFGPPVAARKRIDRIVSETAGAIGPDATFSGVYETARELEKRSHEYYRTQVHAADDPDLLKFFRFLSAVEQSHLEMLAYLVDTTRAAAEAARGT